MQAVKKGWKIALISLGSLLGLVVIVVAVALWLVFTPKQLTGIVNRLASNFVTCETHFGRVNLTLFKTFPDAGLTVNDVYVVNPIEGAVSDTVAHISSLTVGVDVKRYLKEKEVLVHQVLLDGVIASLYTDSAGRSNYDIFPKKEKKEKEKKPFSLDSLPNIDLKRVSIKDLDAQLQNDKGGMYAEVADLDLNVVGTLDEGRVDADLDLLSDKIMLTTTDSGVTKIYAVLDEPTIGLKAKGNLDRVVGRLKMNVEKGRVDLKGQQMINERLQASRHDLLKLDIPFSVNLDSLFITLGDSKLHFDEYALNLKGDVALKPLWMNVDLATDGGWQVAPLLDLVPERYVKFRKGMDVNGKVTLDAHAETMNAGEKLPLITASVGLNEGKFYYPKFLPYKVNRIVGDLDAILDINKKTPSTVTIKSLAAHTRNTDVKVSGKVDDLLGDMHIDAKVKGNLPLEDAKPMIPEKLPVVADGQADLDLHADFRMSQLKRKEFQKMKADGTVKLRRLDVTYDSIHATAPDLDIAVQLPAKEFKNKMGEVALSGSKLDFQMKGIEAHATNPYVKVGVNDLTHEQLAAAVRLSLEHTMARLDSNSVDLSALSLSGSLRFDSTQHNILRKYNPNLDIDLRQTRVLTPLLGEELYVNNLDFHYTPALFDIADADIKLGRSDLQLYGEVENIEAWLSHEKMLVGELNLTSGYTDVDQLMGMFSGAGSDKDTLEQMRQEDNVPKEANPFIVPKDVDFTLHTHIRRSLAFGNDLGDVAGSVTVKDGTAVLDQIGFVCKAATMQLTALYRSPRPSHLFAALDFHLLDIQIDELLDMIPTIDTLVPMLSAFNGNANFHLAAETYLNARYQPLMSSLKGAAAIDGKNLTVFDNNSISQIAKLMQFKSWKDKDNKITIDSLDVELTCLNKVIEVYPFLINMGKYQLCASGMHSLDNQCGYHLELLKNPLLARVGVDVKGSLKSPKISLGEVRYADYYRPDRQGVVERQTLELKRQIKEALEAKVR